MKSDFQAACRALLLAAAAAAGLAAPVRSQAAASITIVNANNPGEGFNDPTPVAPIAGNAGITVGQQRLIAFHYAATIWGAALEASIGISIRSLFSNSLFCSATRATLGVAGPTNAYASSDLPPPGLPDVWYPASLASQLAGFDVSPGNPAIVAQFNSQIGGANCVPGTGWYYGLDGNTGPSQLDLVDVVLHELAHGLGFLLLTNGQTGARLVPVGETQGLPDAWEFKMLDLVTAKHWSEMVDQERADSARRPRKLVWDAANARSAVPGILSLGTPSLGVTSPPGIAGEYLVGEAQFGPPLSSEGVAGSLTAPLDVTGARTGCAALARSVSGGVALLDRGICTFVTKVRNAQRASASAVVIADNGPGSPPSPMGGMDASITIPSVLISQADGQLLRNAIAQGEVAVNEHLLPVRRGADDHDRPMLYTPDQYVPGSSVSHTDPSALLLMDPAYNTALGHKLDLTPYFFRDIGWTVSDPNPPDLSADIAIAVAGPKSYQRDSDVSYSVTVSNRGPSNARDVLVFSTVPVGVTFASSSGGCAGGFPCSLGTMAAGTSRSFTAAFHVAAGYSGDSDLKLTLNAAPPFADPVLTNNAARLNTPLGGGGCASTGPGEPALLAAALSLAALARRSRHRA